jgi:hypothetical protein
VVCIGFLSFLAKQFAISKDILKINGVVYLNYEVAIIFYNLSLYPPLNACNYLGADSEESPMMVRIDSLAALLKIFAS